jgi:hypothetical protein
MQYTKNLLFVVLASVVVALYQLLTMQILQDQRHISTAHLQVKITLTPHLRPLVDQYFVLFLNK